jgi:hypothetical protein
MQDSFSTPNTTDHPQAGEEAGKPLAPLWIFKVMNQIMKGLLRSPLHRLLSGTLMLVTYKGSKTGKQYTIPIGYFAWGQGELMAFSSARWWINLRSSPPHPCRQSGHRAVPASVLGAAGGRAGTP